MATARESFPSDTTRQPASSSNVRPVKFSAGLIHHFRETLQNKHEVPGQRISNLTRQVLHLYPKWYPEAGAFALPHTEELMKTYYPPAGIIFIKRRIPTTEIFLEVLDEELAPYHDQSPIPLAGGVAAIAGIGEEGQMCLLMTKLWTADHFKVDLPDLYTQFQTEAAAHIARFGAGANFLFRGKNA